MRTKRKGSSKFAIASSFPITKDAANSLALRVLPQRLPVYTPLERLSVVSTFLSDTHLSRAVVFTR